MNQIYIATSIQEISDCFPVMSELRPHLSQAEFITQVRRQHEESHYQLAYLQADGSIPQSGGYANEAVAGFRLSESLAWGKFLYVDDLVTRSDRRSQGSGGLLFTWLENYARSNGCQQLTQGFWRTEVCSAPLLPPAPDGNYQSSFYPQIINRIRHGVLLGDRVKLHKN